MKSLRHAATLGAIALAGVAALGAAAGGALVLRVARAVVTPEPRRLGTDIHAVDTAAQTIELARDADTELPGRYGLYVDGTPGYVKLGAVLQADESRVRRKLLTQIDPGAEIGRKAAFSGYYYLTPGELHLPYESVLIGTPAGPAPAWYFPADATTWVIQVHGRGATRSECLRAVPVLHAAGLPVLIASYRNDGEGPRSRTGGYGLGVTEWRDVDAAIGWALRHGAERIVLMGWSMGGAIALQTLMSSASNDAVVGMILDSPVVDWRSVLRFQAREMKLPDPLPQLAMDALRQPWSARLSGADQAIDFDALDMVARAGELDVPILLLHSDDDGYVPADASHALAAARPDIVTMPPFTGARHTKLWNYDQDRWSAAITGWLGANGFLG
ncbi:alpha/beta hydrolase [uncultured Microbacterium sp.]|uniref:alpha/beta hydrolase n=1 Tax=uncultured Microbacterium sp. TaxID=191216 RepID=UPI0025DEEC54|nr:alpha/beta fold hydrolase [uncultured Microbacterium sp.]